MFSAISLGEHHTVCLDVYGQLWCFGSNEEGQLGQGKEIISNLPARTLFSKEISAISCGQIHTLCVDCEGSVWSFGGNQHGQLGIGNFESQYTPQLVDGLPFIQDVSCGSDYSFCKDLELKWYAFGNNFHGQLGTGNKDGTNFPVQLPKGKFSKLFGGITCTVALDENGFVFGFGYFGYKSTLVLPYQIPNLVSIVWAIVTTSKLYFLDSDGIVFCTSEINGNVRELVQYKNVKKITEYGAGLLISNDCGVTYHSNERSFYNGKDAKVLCKEALIMSTNCFKKRCIIQDITGSLFGLGENCHGELSTVKTKSSIADRLKTIPTPFSDLKPNSYKTRSQRGQWRQLKVPLEWGEGQIIKLTQLESAVLDLSPRMLQKPPEIWQSWTEAHKYLESTYQQAHDSIENITTLRKMLESKAHQEKKVLDLETELQKEKVILQKIEQQIMGIQLQQKELKNSVLSLRNLTTLLRDISEAEIRAQNKLCLLLKEKPLQEFSEKEMELVVWKMHLYHLLDLFQENHVTGSIFMNMNESMFLRLGLKPQEIGCLLYQREMMSVAGYWRNERIDCAVCTHDTPELTVNLLKEYEINLPKEIVMENKWIAPHLLFFTDLAGEFHITLSQNISIQSQLNEWRNIHAKHLNAMAHQ